MGEDGEDEGGDVAVGATTTGGDAEGADGDGEASSSTDAASASASASPSGERHLWCTEALCTKEAIEAEKAGQHPYQRDVAEGVRGRGYPYWNKTDFSEELFNRAMWEGPAAVEKLDLVVVTTSYKNPPRFSLDWINVQPFPAFTSTKVRRLVLGSRRACTQSSSSLT